MSKALSYNEMICLKILLSSSSSGCLIGKSGATIRSLEHQFKCRIKLSQSGCFFPKTALRVCLITGAPSSVNSVVAFILDQADVISASVVQRLVVPAAAIGFVIADVTIRSPNQCPIHEELLRVNVEAKIEDLADQHKERIVMLEGPKVKMRENRSSCWKGLFEQRHQQKDDGNNANVSSLRSPLFASFVVEWVEDCVWKNN